MLLRFFRSIGARMLFFIPLLGILFWLHSILQTPDIQHQFDVYPMPLYAFFVNLMPVHSIAGTILALTLVILQSFLLVRLNTRFILINNRTYLPALFFVILTACIPDVQRLNPALFSGFFLLLALEKVLESFHRNMLAHEIFMAALFLGAGAMFYPFMVLMMLSLWVALAIIRPFNWREWVFTILGFLTPVFFLFSFFYLVYSDPNKVFYSFRDAFVTQFNLRHPSMLSLIFIGFTLLMLLISSQYMIRAYQTMKILPRKAFNIFLWVFLNCVGIYLVFKPASHELIFIAAIPVSYLLSHYFARIRSMFWGNIFLLTLLVLIGLIQVLG